MSVNRYDPDTKELKKIAGGTGEFGKKLYLHVMTFRFATPSEIKDGDDYYEDRGFWYGGSYNDYLIGIYRDGINDNWADLPLSGLPELDVSDPDYTEAIINKKTPIRLCFISPIKDPFTTFASFESQFKAYNSKVLLHHEYHGSEVSSRIDNVTFIGNDRMLIHAIGQYDGSSEYGISQFSGNYVPEVWLNIIPDFVADWSDTVTEWN